MKNNKIWTALAIVGMLAVAFFWNDLFQKTTPGPETTSGISLATGAETQAATTSQQEEFHTESEAAVKTKEETVEAEVRTEGQQLAPPHDDIEIKPQEPLKSPSMKEQAELKQEEPSMKEQVEAAQDQHMTELVPEGNPSPVERQNVSVNKNKELTVTLSVAATTILNNLDQFNPDKLEVLPEDGAIYAPQTVTFYEGESVYDVLLREMQNNKIHIEFNSHYIEGINNIYEFDCGELSGWMYKVNGSFPNYGSSGYQLQDGDVVEWVYTCDLGRDVGDEG